MTESNADRDALAADLDRVRRDFHHLLDTTEPNEWDKPTSGTRWTNEQLLFHMVFGYMIVQKLLILVRLFGHLPDPVSRGFSGLLDAATGPFDMINYYGSRMAARVFNRHRMGAELDRVLDSLQHSLAREHDAAFGRGMHYPARWDPYFRDYMTLADIYSYPGRHYDHHRRQLTLAATR
ncbi:DinB family protein [Nocardia vaccinii]|uniref:DinB family protein n=1 Tax=Nocardia vaccinii TaxID=1822 RepID=UPI0008320242|nr:DinB family protein [Nocardia vaccinii]